MGYSLNLPDEQLAGERSHPGQSGNWIRRATPSLLAPRDDNIVPYLTTSAPCSFRDQVVFVLILVKSPPLPRSD